MKKYLPLLLFMCCFAADVSAAAPISGTYSSLHYNEDGGDLLGIEITINREGSGYHAHFQIAEGVASSVVDVPVEVHRGHISFRIPASNDGAGRYSGIVTKKGFLLIAGAKTTWALTGRVPEPDDPFLLPRKRSYWDRRSTSAHPR